MAGRYFEAKEKRVWTRRIGGCLGSSDDTTAQQDGRSPLHDDPMVVMSGLGRYHHCSFVLL